MPTTPRYRPPARTVLVAVRFTPDEAEAIAAAAERTQRTLSDYIRIQVMRKPTRKK